MTDGTGEEPVQCQHKVVWAGAYAVVRAAAVLIALAFGDRAQQIVFARARHQRVELRLQHDTESRTGRHAEDVFRRLIHLHQSRVVEVHAEHL